MNFDTLIQELHVAQEHLDADHHERFFAYLAYCATLYTAAAGAGPKPSSAPTPTTSPFECPSCHYVGNATLS